MSADHGLERQPGIERLADDIRQLQKQLSELRTLQLQGNDAINPQVSSPSLALTWSAVPNGAICAGYFTLASNPAGKRLFGMPFTTFYEGSIAVGNEIGHGNSRDVGYRFNTWLDWGDEDVGNTILICRAEIINNTGGTIATLRCVCNWRYLISNNYTATST